MKKLLLVLCVCVAAVSVYAGETHGRGKDHPGKGRDHGQRDHCGPRTPDVKTPPSKPDTGTKTPVAKTEPRAQSRSDVAPHPVPVADVTALCARNLSAWPQSWLCATPK